MLTPNNLGNFYFCVSGTTHDFNKARACYYKLLEIGSIGSLEEEAKLMLRAFDGANPEEELSKILEKD